MRVSPIDAIGDRLDHPENVPEELKHLIADDVARVEKILSIPVSGRVLDVGCSDGAITRRIRDKWNVQIIGTDINGAWGVPWDAREPWDRPGWAPFDAVFACQVLEHLIDADALKALENIADVLKPGGDLILTVPNRHPNDLYEVGCRSRWAWPDHRSSWTADKLWNALGYAGFRRWTPMPLYPGETFEESIWLIVHASGKK